MPPNPAPPAAYWARFETSAASATTAANRAVPSLASSTDPKSCSHRRLNSRCHSEKCSSAGVNTRQTCPACTRSKDINSQPVHSAFRPSWVASPTATQATSSAAVKPPPRIRHGKAAGRWRIFSSFLDSWAASRRRAAAKWGAW